MLLVLLSPLAGMYFFEILQLVFHIGEF